MRKAFIDPDTRVLKAHGFVNRNDDGDIAINVAEDFDLRPEAWRHDGQDWVPIES
jgi:hypothetical protein